MLLKPHHSPDHTNIEWQDFLTKPWTTKRTGKDLEIDPKTYTCQEDFAYNEIVSCVVEPQPKSMWDGKKIEFSEHQPFYEMQQDGSGKPFANIMEMRSAKIHNFLDVKNYVGVADVWTIQYEYLLSKGTEELLSAIEEVTGIRRKCKAVGPQVRKVRNMSRSFAKFLNQHLDWNAEGLIGYTQREFTEREYQSDEGGGEGPTKDGE